MNDQEVVKALQALAESDRDREAPAAVEARLRSAFRKKYSRPKWPYFAMFAVAAAAAVVFLVNPRPKPAAPQPKEIATVTPPTVVEPAVRPAPKKRTQSRPRPQEVVTDFYPLMEDQPFERGELLRVRVPASTMRSVGLPVSEDRLSDTVQADVLVGEEGLARAIRFVRYVN